MAGRRENGDPSLSPSDVLRLRAGTQLVLASANGATLAVLAAELGAPAVLAGCFRNATALGAPGSRSCAGAPIGLVAAGQQRAGASLRYAIEDLLGAGAVLAALDPSAAVSPPGSSPDAAAARAAFVAARPLLLEHLAASTSGRELAALGFMDDVRTSAALDVTDVAAQLLDGAFVAAWGPPHDLLARFGEPGAGRSG